MVYFEIPEELHKKENEMKEIIEAVIEGVLAEEKINYRVEVSVLITGSAVIKELNAQYRGIDSATDVLSFGQEDVEVLWPNQPADQPRLLGDIVIAFDVLEKQAEDYGHSWQRELGFLTSHGMLHLLGYEHGEDESDTDLKTMLSKQEAVLAKLELKR